MNRKSIIKQYLSAGKKLMPVNGKIPTTKDWVERSFNEEEIYGHKGNLGWVLGESDLVIDVDPRNGGTDSFNDLVDYLGTFVQNPIEYLERSVDTPSGGFHIYLELPEKYRGGRFKKNLNKEYPGIDFLTKGSYCIIPSSKTTKLYVWSDDLFGGFYPEPAPGRIVDLISYTATQGSNDDELGDFEGQIGGDSATWAEEDVVAMIDKLDPSMSNSEWVKVGMALHDWDPIQGLRLWEEWSKDGDNYIEDETAKRWKSFDIGGGVTLGTISYMCKEAVFDTEAFLVSNYIDLINKSDEKNLEFVITSKIAKEKFGKVNLAKIVKAIQDRYKALAGIRIPVASVRQMVTADVVSGQFIDDLEAPAWCDDWVYVNSHTGFMNLKELSLYKSESFNVLNGKRIPLNDTGSKTTASRYVADSGFVQSVNSMCYLPTVDSLICEFEGKKVLNTFNPASVPVAAEKFTDEGLAAIERIKRHIKFICGTDKNADIFTQWIAHQIQFPGKQILWSPVIQSIEGVGKSFFGELLRCCLGDRNVGVVSPTQVISNFNGWATNVCVNMLEELRITGHNRHEAVNALKPLITDRIIQINEKGVKQYQTYNTCNYICFTNFKDAIPMTDNDRRWWVIFVQIDNLDELRRIIGEDAAIYFPKLFDCVRKHSAEIRKWLLEYNVTKEFLETKQAPMTDYKLSMIATEEDSFEGLSQVRELIEEGGLYYNTLAISSPDLFEQLSLTYPELDINTRGRNVILKKLGYSLVPKPVKIDGRARRIWTKRPMSSKEARLYLKGGDEYLEDI